MAVLSAHAQSTFQDPNFESANVPIVPYGQYGEEATTASALPGWNASIGGVAVTQVILNAYSGGMASIDLFGPGWIYANPGIIDGNYTVYLQAFGAGQGNVSIWQNGTIPGNAESLQFEAWGFDPASALSVSFAGNSLSPVLLSSGQDPSGQDDDVYGADIAPYSGQTGTLEFTAVVNGLGESATELDDITFCPTSVPEPNTLALLVMGGLALAARRRRRKDS